MENRRVDGLMWLPPPPVQVHAQYSTPMVPIHHSIRIQHWYHFEHELVSELFGHRTCTGQEVQHSLHHVGPDCLAWVHSRAQKYTMLLRDGGLGVGDGQVVAGVAGERTTEFLFGDKHAFVRVGFQLQGTHLKH